MARAITNYANALLKPMDLNLPQISLLAAIAMNPEKTLAAMSDALALDASTLTRNLIVLEGRGLIASEGGRGRGGKRVYLTDDGRVALERGMVAWAEFNETICSQLPDGLLASGTEFMERVTEVAERLNGTPTCTETTSND